MTHRLPRRMLQADETPPQRQAEAALAICLGLVLDFVRIQSHIRPAMDRLLTVA